MSMLLAQAMGGYSLAQIVIWIIVILGIIGVGSIIVKQMGIQIPGFIIQILWICLAVFVGIVAIKFLLSM